MQRVTNCVIRNKDQILLLKKPKRGWWYSAGGKMEAEESILQAVTREVTEETGLQLIHPRLRGISTILIQDQGKIIDDWMLFTFLTDSWTGELHHETKEGELSWLLIDQVSSLPMPEGDRILLNEIIKQDALIVARFIYTPDYQLLNYELSYC